MPQTTIDVTQTTPVDLSKAVRPFLSPTGQPTRKRTERGFYFGTPSYVPPSTTEADARDGQLIWSASQSAAVTTLGAMGFTVDWEDDPNNEYAEIVRSTHVQRIENPDDPDQFVEVEVIDAISYNNGKKIRSNYSLNN